MRDAGVVDVAQHARRAGDEHERVGLQRAGELVGDDVGVDVVDGAVAAVAETGDHRQPAAVEHAREERQVEVVDVADVAEVDRLGTAAGDDARRSLVRAHNIVEADGLEPGARAAARTGRR